MALSFADASALDAKIIDVLDDLDLALWSTTPNLSTNTITVETANIGENQEAIASVVQSLRDGAGSLLTESAVQAILLPLVQEWCVSIGAPEGRNVDFDTGMDRIRDYYVANSKSNNSRGITYGSVSAVTGTGNGTVRRLTVCDEGFSLEGCHAEAKRFECKLDQTNVEKHHEVFEATGAVPFRDGLKRTGSGLVQRLVCLTTRDSSRYLTNPSFNQYEGTTQPTAGTEQTITAVTAITGWTADSVTSCKISLGPSDASYRDLVGEPAPSRMCVKFEADRTLTQTLNQNQNPTFDQGVPYYFQVAVYRGSSCDGTLTITFGATTRAVDMTTLSNGAWNVVTLTLNKGLYPRNFRTNNMTVAFALASRTTGHLYLDDIVGPVPMTLVDGLWCVAVGGATPFVRGDYMTVTDSEATRGKRQYWHELRSGRGRRGKPSLPSNNAGSETEADL